MAVTTPRVKLPDGGATTITASTRFSAMAAATPSGSSGTCVTAPGSKPYSASRSLEKMRVLRGRTQHAEPLLVEIGDLANG